MSEFIEQPEVENTDTSMEVESKTSNTSVVESKKAVETYLAKDADPSVVYDNKPIQDVLTPDFSKPQVLKTVPKSTTIDRILDEDLRVATALKDSRHFWDKAVNTATVIKKGLTEGAAGEVEKGELGYKLLTDKENFTDVEMTRLTDLLADEDNQENLETLWDGTESVTVSVGQFLRNAKTNLPGAVGAGVATGVAATGAAAAAGAITAPVTGGVSLLAAGSFGLTTGLSGASLYLSGGVAYESFKQQSGSFYVQMKQDPNLKMSDGDLKALSLGLGATVGALDFFIAKGATKGINYGETLLKNKGVRDALIKTGKFILDKGVDGANEALQEIAQIAAEKAARGEEVTLAGLSEESQRIGQAYTAGAVASTTLEGATVGTREVIGKTYRFGKSLGETGSIEVKNKTGKVKFVIKDENADKATVRKMQRMVLQEKAINELTDAINNSKLETDTTNYMLRKSTESDNVYLNKEAVEEIIAKNEKAKEYVQENIGIDIQDGHAVSPAVIAQLNAIDPGFNNTWSIQPQGPTMSTLQQYFKGLNEAIELGYSLDEDVTGLSEEQRGKLPKILREAPEADRSNPGSINTYSVSNLFRTEGVKVPPKFSSKLNTVLQNLKEDSAMRTVIDTFRKINQAVNLDFSTNIMSTVEGQTLNQNSLRYHNTHKKFSTRTYSKLEQKLPSFDPTGGYSPYAIDPTTLDVRTRLQYQTNPTLIKLGVFADPSKVTETTVIVNDPIGTTKKKQIVKKLKGMDANESANMLGYGSPRELFAALIISDNEFESVSTALEGTDLEELYNQSLEDVGPTIEDLTRAINDVESHRRKEIRQLFTQAKDLAGETIKGVRTYTKEAIVKLARGMRSSNELAAEAVRIARTLNVRNLDPDKYRSNSNKLRVDSIVAFQEGRYEDAIKASEQSILNLHIEKEVLKINKELNRKIKKLKTLTTVENRNILLRADPTATKALDNIMQIFNFNREYDIPTQEALDLLKSIDTQENYFLPITNGYAPKASINDLSAQTTLALAETALNIFDTVKEKDKQDGQMYDADQKKTFIDINSEIQSKLIYRKDYKSSNWDNRPTSENKESTIRQRIGLTGAMLTRVQSVIKNKLDRNVVGGYFTKLFWTPVERSNDQFRNILFAKDQLMTRAMDIYGKDNWVKLAKTEITDQRLIDNQYFKSRKPTKLDVIVMALNTGNLGNLEVLSTSMGLRPEEIRSIVDDNLTTKDWKLIQTMWDSFTPLWDETVKMKKAVREDIPEKVEAQQFTLKDGTVIKGGYYPIKYQFDAAKSNQSDLMGNTGKQALKFENMSQNGHNESRLQNVGRKLNLDIEVYNQAFREIAYDTSFRKVIRNLNNILANQDNQKHLYNILGEGDYQALKEWTEELSNTRENMGQLERNIDKSVSTLQMMAARGYLGFKLKTSIIQVEALWRGGYAIAKDMGGIRKMPAAAKRVFLESLSQFLTMKPDSMQAQLDAVSSVSPRFRDLMRQMGLPENFTAKESFSPDERNKISKFYDKTTFAMLGYMNTRINLAVWFSAVKLAEDGQIPNVDPNNKQDVYDYATSVVTLHLQGDEAIDKSRFQHSKGVMKLFTTFMSQQNVRFNEIKASANNARIGWLEANSFRDRVNVVGTAAMDLTMQSILPAIFVGLVANLFKEEDDRDNLLVSAMLDPINTIPLGSSLTYQISQYIEEGKARQTEAVAAISFLNDVVAANAAILDRILTGDEIKENELRRIVNVVQATGIPIRQVMATIWLAQAGIGTASVGIDALESFVLFHDAPKTLTEYDQGIDQMIDDANLTEDQQAQLQQVNDVIDQVEAEQGEPSTYVASKEEFDNPQGQDKLVRAIGDDTKDVEINPDMHDDLVNIATIIRFAESSDLPLAQPYYNGKLQSSAKGYYQVLDDTADRFDKAYPLDGFDKLKELPDGNDPVAIKEYNEIQNKFIWREFAENVDALRTDKLPVNAHTLYAMHMLGSKNGRAIFKESNNKTIPKSMMSALMANPKATMGVSIGEASKVKRITYGQVRDNIVNYLSSRIADKAESRGEEYRLLMSDYLDTDIDIKTN